MGKWLRGLLILIFLVGFGQVAFAVQSPEQPKPLIPTFEDLQIQGPAKNSDKKQVLSPSDVKQKATKKIEKIKDEIQKSWEGTCDLWWQFVLISAVFLLVFAVFAKTRPEYFPGNWIFSIYLVPPLVGYITWLLHDYMHFHVKKYEISFLCYNYWLVVGFEVFYFLMVYLLVFGFKKVGVERQDIKNKKDKTKKTTANKPKKAQKNLSKRLTKTRRCNILFILLWEQGSQKQNFQSLKNSDKTK